ncbi:cupin-like domain-containing protein [Arenibacter algicola]|uniref:cupin-like domain-containing protein n=1 Tax=Arenibacter algicola TaxID=616991 RepID=UPI001C0780BE|nr:cupin-like domain-containing protein [Arenibacter algicola]MBU2904274.1 cupin-like domain-containing protein [Arenibacter algicola]
MDILSDILGKSEQTQSVPHLDSTTFKKDYLKANRPVVIKGMAENWPAKKKWSIDFFLDLESNKPVPLEVGNIFQNESKFLKKDFKQYLNTLKKEELNQDKDKTYLSMFNIFDQFPDLKTDTDFSIFSKFTKLNNTYAWIGPSGTISGLHWDSVNNMLAQLKGRKLVLLASPKFQKEMYISKKFDLGSTFSQVDINNLDENLFPKFKDVKFYQYTLEPGDVLFIPVGWWHYVKSLDVSISVNNFGYLPIDMLTTNIKELILERLHVRGLYRKNYCTCHSIVDGKRVSKY